MNLTPIQLPSNFEWFEFEMKGVNIESGRIYYNEAGPYVRLRATFKLRRNYSHYLLNFYLPSALFVISSWCSFWIDINGQPARVALVLTTMLTHITNSKSLITNNGKMFSSLDIWVTMCTSKWPMSKFKAISCVFH